MAACAAAGKLPPPGWTAPDESVPVISLANVDRRKDSERLKTLGSSDITNHRLDYGANHSIGLPIHVYPLYENAFRAHRNQSIPENDQESAQIYAEFARVAEQNPLAWNYGQPAATAETIKTVTKRNRMICFPCECFT